MHHVLHYIGLREHWRQLQSCNSDCTLLRCIINQELSTVDTQILSHFWIGIWPGFFTLVISHLFWLIYGHFLNIGHIVVSNTAANLLRQWCGCSLHLVHFWILVFSDFIRFSYCFFFLSRATTAARPLNGFKISFRETDLVL